ELARIPAAVAETRQDLERLAFHDVDLHVLAVSKVDETLVRVVRERDVPDRAIAESRGSDALFLDERAVRFENLDAIVHPVADVDETVVGGLGTVHRVTKLLRRRRIGVVRTEVRVIRFVAVRAPEALQLP